MSNYWQKTAREAGVVIFTFVSSLAVMLALLEIGPHLLPRISPDFPYVVFLILLFGQLFFWLWIMWPKPPKSAAMTAVAERCTLDISYNPDSCFVVYRHNNEPPIVLRDTPRHDVAKMEHKLAHEGWKLNSVSQDGAPGNMIRLYYR